MTKTKSWSKKDQQRLIELYQLGDKFNEIATKLNRTYSAIASEVQELRKAGKLGYRKSNAEAADADFEEFCKEFDREQAEKKREFVSPIPVDFTDHGVKVRLSANDEEAEQAEQAERAERKANTIFNEILENIRYTHDKKNDDYKDSYSDTMKRFGTKSGLVRIYDKFNRIENILNSEGKANFESAEDNLQDLATYAIMMLGYIKRGGNK